MIKYYHDGPFIVPEWFNREDSGMKNSDDDLEGCESGGVLLGENERIECKLSVSGFYVRVDLSHLIDAPEKKKLRRKC